MNKTVKFYWFVIFLSCMCNFKSVFSEESVPVHYKGKYTSDIKNYEIVFPQRVNKDGSFISHLVSHHHSKRSTKELDFIFYKIPIGGKDYLIELTPNRKLISPGAVVEIHREDARKTADRKYSNQSINDEQVTKMFRNLDIRKLENTDCHFSGHVKGENTSKAALSTCYGLAGFIQIHKGFYTIEPVAEHNPFLEGAYPHILYKTDGLDNSSVCHTMGELAASVVDGLVRKRRQSSVKLKGPIYIETLIVMDKTFINYYEDSDCENYVLTVFNMAFNLFRDASSGLLMTLTLVRLIRLEVEQDAINLKVSADAAESLRSFQTWQYQINPGDDTHPNHHDIALLVTKVDVCYSPSACGLLGVTTIGKGCDPLLSAALCEDKGLRLGYVMAHEIGHLLGADHDCINSTCNGTDADGLKTVMHPRISTTSEAWSSCSKAYFKEFFSSGKGYCFFDEPEEHHFNVHDLLPGVMYNADFQCKHLIATGARECERGSTCESLNCLVPGYNCIVTHTPPADGTRCGEDMWCLEDRCLVIGERPGAVDGNWGEWSAWSDCSRTCGSGVASSTRNCDKPQPSHGGRDCVGERKRYKICAATPCQTGRPSFRDIQCGEFDDWIYPEDGKTHSWKSYFFHDDNPCVLYCINEEKSVVALRPRVVDGTMCFRGIRDVCIGGICKSLPCDLKFDSKAVEDACGICHGDGANCEFSEGKEAFTKLSKGFSKLVNVPSGARNIKVEETTPTLSKIIVRDRDTKEIYVRGKTLGMHSVPGSQAWLGMIRKNQEALTIPGPVTKPLTILIQRSENVTVKWSMALPLQQQRKPEYAWNFLKWGPCSAFCGPGTQKSEPSCMEEKAGLVENSFCADLEMPVAKVRQCEIMKCQSRWMVGDWKPCNPREKVRKRVVYCIKPIGEIEGESQIVPDSECVNPKPHDSEPCENRQKREDTEYNFSEPFLETDTAQFKPDNSEFGFHKKYEVYLKHFAALPVPQRKSETVPLHLVSSPHFKHYFHVLETPADPETGLVPAVDVSLPNVTTYNLNTQSKVSPEFLTETFSGQRIGITHAQSVPQDRKNSPVHRMKKNSNSNYELNVEPNAHPKFKGKLKKSPQMWNKAQDFNQKQRYHSNWAFDEDFGGRTRYVKRPINSLTQKIKSEFNWKRKKKFKQNYLNLSEYIQSVQDREKFNLSDDSTGSLPFMEENRLDVPYNHKSISQKLSSFLSHFTKSHENYKKYYETSDYEPLHKPIKPNGKDYDGSGLKRVHLKKDEVKGNLKDSDILDLLKKDKSFDFLRMGRLDLGSKKLSGARPLTLKDLLNDKKMIKKKKKKKFHRVKKFVNRKKTAECRRLKLNKKLKFLRHRRMYKQKRSNRKWKRPKSKDANSKSGKDSGGPSFETRKYLNNLFGENRSKIFNPKNAQPSSGRALRIKCPKPIINEGAVVIDHDLPENQIMEIVLEEDDLEPKLQKYEKLPQPPPDGKPLVITGPDVFNLLCELQNRSLREVGLNELNKATTETDLISDAEGKDTSDEAQEKSVTDKLVEKSKAAAAPKKDTASSEAATLEKDTLAIGPKKSIPSVAPNVAPPAAEPEKGAAGAKKGASTPVTEKSAPAAVPEKGAPAAEPEKGGSASASERGAPSAEPEKGGSATVPGKNTSPAEPGKGAPAASPGKGAPAALPGKGAPAASPGKGAPAAGSVNVTPAADPGKVAPTAAPDKATTVAEPAKVAPTLAAEAKGAPVAGEGTPAAEPKKSMSDAAAKGASATAPEKTTDVKGKDKNTQVIQNSSDVKESKEANAPTTEPSDTTEDTENSDYSDGCDYNFHEVVIDPDPTNDDEEEEEPVTKKSKKKDKSNSSTKESFYFK